MPRQAGGLTALSAAVRHNSLIAADSAGTHRLSYTVWACTVRAPEGAGDQDAAAHSAASPSAPLPGCRTIVAVHGLTCVAADFGPLAETLAAQGHVFIGLDLPGRGRSDFLADGKDYNYRQYLADIAAFLSHLGFTKENPVTWLGVSLGGLLGMRLAAGGTAPVNRLILNDIGPSVPREDLDFISAVIAQPREFAGLREMEDFMRGTRGLSWGKLTDAQWAMMAENNARRLPGGTVTFSYDPRIAPMFAKEPTGEADIWPYWDVISCPCLILRGEKSTVFPPAIAGEMMRRGPARKGLATLREIPGCGHVPSLMTAEQIAIIAAFVGEGA